MADVRREWVVAAAALAALTVIVLLLMPPARQAAYDRRLSTFRTTPDGAGALYALLRDLGVPVDQRTMPLTTTRGTRALALLAPSEPLSPLERDSLLEWVRGGGTLIAALSPRDPLLDRLGVVSAPTESAGRVALPAPGPLTEGIDSIGPVQRVLRDTLPKEAPRQLAERRTLLWHPGGDMVALRARVGDGTVILISEPGLLANERIGAGVATLFARAAAEATASGAALEFDEYHHGHTGGTPGRALSTFVREQPAGRAALQLALVALLALAPAAVRLGSPVPPDRPARRSPLEHVAALGEVYRQARAEELARRRVLVGFARRLGRERPAPGAEAAFLDRLERGAPAEADAVGAIRRAWEGRAPVRELSLRIDHAVNRLNRKS